MLFYIWSWSHTANPLCQEHHYPQGRMQLRLKYLIPAVDNFRQCPERISFGDFFIANSLVPLRFLWDEGDPHDAYLTRAAIPTLRPIGLARLFGSARRISPPIKIKRGIRPRSGFFQNPLDFCLTKDYNQYCSDSSLGNSANAHGVFGSYYFFLAFFCISLGNLPIHPFPFSLPISRLSQPRSSPLFAWVSRSEKMPSRFPCIISFFRWFWINGWLSPFFSL